MQEKKRVVVRRTQTEWARLVEAFKESGKSMAEWCRENSVSEKTMGAHVRTEGIEKRAKMRSAQEWAVLIEEQQRSGMKRGAWCRARDINPELMTKAEMRQKARENTKSEPTWVELGATEGAKPLPQAENEGADWGLRIRSGNLEIEVHADYPAQKLAALLERLVKLC